MKTNTNQILKLLHVITWVVFIGLCIKAGALIFNYLGTIIKSNNEGAKDLFLGLNLFDLKTYNNMSYSLVALGIIAVIVFQAYLFFTLIKIFKQINIQSPFSEAIGKLIKLVSLVSFVIGLLSICVTAYAQQFINKGLNLAKLPEYVGNGNAFIFFAGVMYFISVMFKKGIELQTENELTF